MLTGGLSVPRLGSSGRLFWPGRMTVPVCGLYRHARAQATGFAHTGRLCRAGLVAVGKSAARGPFSHLAPCCGFRAVGGGSDLWEPVPRWSRAMSIACRWVSPSRRERLIELGGAQLLADLGYSSSSSRRRSGQAGRPTRWRRPSAAPFSRAARSGSPSASASRAYAARHSVTNGVLRAARPRSSASSISARASSAGPAGQPGCPAARGGREKPVTAGPLRQAARLAQVAQGIVIAA